MTAMRQVLPLAMVLIGVLYAVAVAAGLIPPGGDAYAYWLADPLDPYAHSTVGSGYAYLYSPAFAQAIEPLQLLGWPAFLFVWTVLLAVALAWAGKWWAIIIFILPPIILQPPVFASFALGLTAVAVLVPSLLYYGGGWLQYGYRYALDSIPFVIALCGLAAARHGVSWFWRVLILFGVVVGLGGVYWAYNMR